MKTISKNIIPSCFITMFFFVLLLNCKPSVLNDNTNNSITSAGKKTIPKIEKPKYIGVYQIIATELALREKPSRKSALIEYIRNGRLVNMLASKQIKTVINGKPGKWVWVEYRKKTGYMFDAYLKKAKKVDISKQIKYHSQKKKFHCENVKSFYCIEDKILRMCPKNIIRSYSKKSKIKRYYKSRFKYNAKLKLIANNGKVKYFNDIDKPNSDGLKYYTIKGLYLDNQFILITVSYWEGGTNYLFNLGNGEISEIWSSTPVQSESKYFLIATSASASYGPNGIQIFKNENNSLKKVFESGPNWHPHNPEWISDTLVKLMRSRLDTNFGYISKAELIYENGKWVLYE